MLFLPAKLGYRKLDTKTYLRVRSCYYISVNEEMLYSHRFLEYCEMIYVIAGKMYIAVAGKEYAVSAGEIFVIPCFLTVDGVQRSDGKTSYCTVEFSCSDSLIKDIACKVISIREDAYFVSKLFSRLNDALIENGPDDNYEGDSILLNILYGLYRNSGSSDRGSVSTLSAVMDYINEHIDKMLTIEGIAYHFGYNKDYLLKIFRERYGITIKKYINEKKLTMVKRLLVTTDVPVEKIGASIGFEETELFEKYFKYHEKVTPQRYRKMYR